MGEVVNLKPVSLIDNQDFISDMCRFSENILSEAAVRKKHRMTESAWEALALDDELVRTISAESVRRIRCGDAKREKAQLLVTRAPDVLGKIMDDDSQSARHRIDSCKVLNDFAADGPAGAPAADRFVISIVLSADGIPHTEHYNKSIKPDADDVDPNGIGIAPMIAAIAAKKTTESGGGNAI